MTKSDLKNHLAEGRLAEALQFLRNDAEEHLRQHPQDSQIAEQYQIVLRNAARLHTAERERHLELITREEHQVVQGQVQQAIFFVLNHRSKHGWNPPAPAVPASPVQPKKPTAAPPGNPGKPPAEDLILIPGGPFKMGDEFGDLGDTSSPVHTRHVPDFYLAKYPITQRQWRAAMAGENPARFRGDNLPVHGVDWDEVHIFIQRLNSQTGLHYRLPTEAEWEYAARGGQLSQGYKYAGSHLPNEVAWHDNNSARRPRPIDSKLPNELGLYSMSGNVWEWVEDDWHYSYFQKQGTPKDARARIGTPRTDSRVVRGGSCLNDVKGCRLAYRTFCPVKNTHEDFIIGFRLAHDLQ
jgi:sulfatase modifying factor 1